MRSFSFYFIFLFILLVSCSHLRRFTQEELRPNQYLIFDDDDTAILVDTGNGDAQGTQDIINFITNNNINHLDTIFITHAQADQIGGIPVLAEQYPSAVIEVPNIGVYEELLEIVVVEFPTVQFDWANEIEIHDDDDTLDELDLILYEEFVPAETAAYGMLYNADLNYIITGDALYIDYHPYLGPDVNLARLRSWYGNTLVQLSPGGVLGANENTEYHPGHGPPGDFLKVNELSGYLQRFEDLVLSCPNTETPIALSRVRSTLIQEYPAYEGEEILDLMVSNQNWILAQDANDPCSIFDIYTSILSTDNAGILSISIILTIISFILLL